MIAGSSLFFPRIHIKYVVFMSEHASCLPQGIIHLLNELYQKETQRACKARNCSHVQEDFRPYNQDITVRNKTFVQYSYICSSIEIWDRQRIINIRLIWIAK